MRVKGPWSPQRIASFLEAAKIPLRLAVVRPDGFPLVLSLWFTPRDGMLCCATGREALVAKLLRGQPRCAFEVAADTPPYKGVRGRGIATLHDDRGAETLSLLLARYGHAPDSRLGRTLLARAANETEIRIRPESILSWDFSARMTG